MDDLQSEKLKKACVIIVEGLGKAAESAKKAISSLAESFAGIDLEITFLCEEFPRDPFEDLTRAMEEISGSIDSELMQEFAELAAEMPPIIHKKIPRPPKCTGPVNKMNFSANRPPRRARSSCRIVKR